MAPYSKGSGPAVVLIPGLAASHRVFDPVVAGLSRDHRVVTIDLPGHGDRDDPGVPPTLRDCAAELHEVVESLGPAPVSLVGWSLGATVAWQYLTDHGTQRVNRLVSVEQTPLLTTAPDWPYGAFGSLDAAGARALLDDVERDCGTFAETLVRSSFASHSEPDPDLLAALVAQGRRAGPTAVHGLLSDVLRQDWRDRIGAIKVPTLLIHGRRSLVYPAAVGDWLAGALPDARVEFLENSGHLCFLEEPDRFNLLLRTFLTKEENA